MTDVCTGGMVEYCHRLNIKPCVLFSDTRKDEVRLKKGMLFFLSIREGYTLTELMSIYNITYGALKRSIDLAEKTLMERKNPIASEMWSKVKDLTFSRKPDYRKMYEKEVEQIK